jgi:RsmE family RNA methyltransferase
MQCRRTWLPQVDVPASFATVAGLEGAALADIEGAPPTLARPTVLVGPEGGWSPRERNAVLPRVRVGAHVLRAETAALTVGALLAALRDQLLAEPRDLRT